MALQHIAIAGNEVAMGYDSSTGEAGIIIKLLNKTSVSTVKGTLVSASTGIDRAFILQANEYDTIGVVQEAGVPDGSKAWVWMPGSIAQVLFKDSTASTRGNILIADAVDGRAIDITNPGSGLPATETHFKECGHVLESKNAGTNVLVLAALHFN